MTKTNSFSILWLALGVFGIITTEMGIVGVLPQITEKFQISTAQAGGLVSIFALVVAISGPFLTLLASGLNRKKVLLFTVLMFALSNLVYAYTEHFEIMLAFRILPALFHPVFFSIALVTAAQLVSPEKSTRAVTQVFAGITAGFAFGVPLTSYLAARLSLEAAFGFAALVSLIALVGMLIGLPSLPVSQKISYGAQLRILRSPRLWLNILAVVFIFAAMFSVYSYFSEYLTQVTHMSHVWISVMLMVFGVVMIAGNFGFGELLQKNRLRTVLAFPVLLILIFLLIHNWGYDWKMMIILILVWGIIHSGGLVVSQTWLMMESGEAPELGNSLFVSFSNLGITVGTAISGLFITHLGMDHLFWCGILFALAAFILIIIRVLGIQQNRRE
ncbi:MFS transporter [Paenibacillus shenyangensis]|uniref:MFS transporter n=1 Tax=Paenibacillus sp. A9 TaxID=1284352 RepID=UPI0003757D62|nr:MFS transporter [Paenibacillus sp. A9]